MSGVSVQSLLCTEHTPRHTGGVLGTFASPREGCAY